MVVKMPRKHSASCGKAGRVAHPSVHCASVLALLFSACWLHAQPASCGLTAITESSKLIYPPHRACSASRRYRDSARALRSQRSTGAYQRGEWPTNATARCARLCERLAGQRLCWLAGVPRRDPFPHDCAGQTHLLTGGGSGGSGATIDCSLRLATCIHH